MGDDDLNIVIGLIADFDPVELARSYARLLETVSSNSVGTARKEGEKVGKASMDGFQAGQKKGAGGPAGEKVIADAMRDQLRKVIDGNQSITKAQASALNAQVKLLQIHFRERLAALENAFKNERNELRKNYSIELEERRSANRAAQAADNAAERERMVRLAAKLRDETDLNRLSIRATERNQASLAAAKAKRDRQVEAKQRAADQAAEFDRRKAAQVAATALARLDREAATDRQRIARESAQGRARAESAANSSVLQAQRAGTAMELAEARRSGAEKLQAQRAADRSTYVEEQASQARRTAIVRAALRGVTSTYEAGLRGTQSIVSSFLRRRENSEKSSGDKITNIYEASTSKQTSEIRQQLERQNTEYSTAARRRLATIEGNAARETEVITANAVRQAEATAAIQKRTSSGVIGAAAGRSATGNFLQTAVIGSGVGLAIKSLISAASSLNESQSKVEVVFGSSAKAVKDFASTAATSLGISKQAALEAASTYGNLFQSFGVGRAKATEMSTGLVQLASDLASFNNTSVDDAIEALRSGLTGETEPLKRYGIAINDVTLKAKALELGLLKTSVNQADVTKGSIALEKAQYGVAVATKKYGAESIQAREASSKLQVITDRLGKTMEGKLPAQLTSAQKAQAAYALIMERSSLAQGDFARTSTQFANTSRITIARLQDLRANLGTGLLPIALGLGLAFNKVILPALEGASRVLSTFIRNVATGTGVFKVLREGLIGVAVVLAGFVALKGAVEVFGLLSKGLLLIAANPGIIALVALGAAAVALYRNVPAIQGFFSALVTGTRDWIKVGFNIDRPVTNLSKIVALQTGLGATARSARDLFVGLRDGTRDWITVAREIDRPVTSLSNIVAIQTGLGFAAGAIKDHLDLIGSGIRDLAKTGDTANLRGALSGLAGDLATGLGPVAAKLTAGLRDQLEEVRDWLTDHVGPILSSARLDVAGFIIGALGIGGKGSGIVEKVVGKALTRVLAGSIADLSTDEGAVSLGAKVSAIFSRGVDIAKSTGINIASFITGLFSGNLEFGNTANNIGARLRATIEAGLSRVGDLSAPLGAVIGTAAGALGDIFGKYVLPKLIELPRLLGRAISRTAFSEPFLKTVLAAAAGLVAAAVVLGGQFIRGFAEGLFSRRGDILSTLVDAVTFAFDGVAGALGTPVAVIASLIIGAFAGAKVLGAIGKLRGIVKVAGAAMTGDFQKTQAAAGALRAESAKITGPGAGVANKVLAVRGAYDTVTGAVKKASGASDSLRLRGMYAADGIRRSFHDLPASLTVAFDKLPAPIAKTLNGITAGASRMIGSLASVVGRATTAISTGFDKIKAKAKDVWTDPERRAQAFQSTMQVVGGAVAGYFAGMADSAEAKGLAVVGALSNVAGAFALGGPVVGGITAVATGIGYVFGQAQKHSKETKARIAADAAALKVITDDLGTNLAASFKELGSTNALARSAVAADVLKKGIEGGGEAYKSFVRTLGGTTGDLAKAFGGGVDAVKKYGDALVDTKVDQLLRGQLSTIDQFPGTYAKAIDSIRQKAQGLASVQAGAFDPTGGLVTLDEIDKLDSGLDDIFSKIASGKVSIRGGITAFSDLKEELTGVGLSAKESRDLYDTFAATIREGVSSTPGGTLAGALSRELATAIENQKAFGSIQAEAIRISELQDPIAERFSRAYGRIKDGFDRARTAYENFIDSQNGKKVTETQARVDLRGIAADATRAPTVDETGKRTETAQEEADRKTLATADAQRRLSDVIAGLGAKSGNIEDLRGKLDAYFATLKEGASPETIAFFDELRKGIPDGALESALPPALTKIAEVRQAIDDLIALPENRPLQIKVEEAQSFQAKRTAIIAQLHGLEKESPSVAAYLRKGDNFQTTLDSILADARTLNGLNVKINVKIQATVDQILGDLTTKTGKSIGELFTGQAEGAYVDRPGLFVRGEGSRPELVLPLTNPKRMAELLGLPQVRKALNQLPPRSGALPGASSSYGQGASSVGTNTHRVEHHQPITIVEAASPRQSAMEVVRAGKAAEFRSGSTLGIFT